MFPDLYRFHVCARQKLDLCEREEKCVFLQIILCFKMCFVEKYFAHCDPFFISFQMVDG